MVKIGISIELKIGEYEKIKNDLIKLTKTEDSAFLENILLKFGKKIDDRYLLLHNESSEEYNSYYNISKFIDRYYNVENSHNVLFEHLETLEMNHSIEDAEETLFFEFSEED
jgi:D-hexose-6-phosphate mutarotase